MSHSIFRETTGDIYIPLGKPHRGRNFARWTLTVMPHPGPYMSSRLIPRALCWSRGGSFLKRGAPVQLELLFDETSQRGGLCRHAFDDQRAFVDSLIDSQMLLSRKDGQAASLGGPCSKPFAAHHARVVYDPFRFFLKVNSPRFVGELTPKVNSRPESETIILLVVECKILEGRIWVLVHSLVASVSSSTWSIPKSLRVSTQVW